MVTGVRRGSSDLSVLLTHAQLNWANPRSLAATCGISVDFFSSGYLDVSVLPVRFHNLCIQLWMTLRSGCPIRRSPDHSLLSASRGFSQITTSFFACCRQGIHRVHLFTWSYNLKLSFGCAVLSLLLYVFRFWSMLGFRLAHSSPVGYAEENISNNVLFFSVIQFSCFKLNVSGC